MRITGVVRAEYGDNSRSLTGDLVLVNQAGQRRTWRDAENQTELRAEDRDPPSLALTIREVIIRNHQEERQTMVGQMYTTDINSSNNNITSIINSSNINNSVNHLSLSRRQDLDNGTEVTCDKENPPVSDGKLRDERDRVTEPAQCTARCVTGNLPRESQNIIYKNNFNETFPSRSLIEEHAASCGGNIPMSPTRHVSCPICTENFPHNLIERHAATCGEGVPV